MVLLRSIVRGSVPGRIVGIVVGHLRLLKGWHDFGIDVTKKTVCNGTETGRQTRLIQFPL